MRSGPASPASSSKPRARRAKGLQKVGRASRQLGSSGSRSDLDDSPPPSRGEVSAYAGLGPTGTAQDVRTPCLMLNALVNNDDTRTRKLQQNILQGNA